MEKLGQFIVHHWLLVTAFLVAFFLLLLEEVRNQGGGGSRLTPQAATRLINDEKAVVIDIREMAQFNEGHLPGALSMPYAQLSENSLALEKHKQRPLIIVCGTGQKSITAMNKLRKQGYTKTYILAGGVNAWNKASMPLVK